MLTECQILARNEGYMEKNMEKCTRERNTLIGRVTMKTEKCCSNCEEGNWKENWENIVM